LKARAAATVMMVCDVRFIVKIKGRTRAHDQRAGEPARQPAREQGPATAATGKWKADDAGGDKPARWRQDITQRVGPGQ
jgi:hypothetical protein